MHEFHTTFRKEYTPQENRLFCVDIESEEYQRNRRELKERALKEQNVYFGAELDSALFERDRERIHRELQEFLGQCARSEDIAGYLGDFVRNIFYHQGAAHPHLAQLVQAGGGERKFYDNFIATLLDRKMPMDAMRHCIGIHREAHMRAVEGFERKLPQLRRQFMYNMHALMDDPRHPLQRDMISDDMLRRRIDEVAIVAADPLVLYRGQNQLIIGEYDHNRNRAAVIYAPDTMYMSSKVFHTVSHELLHVLAGRTVRRHEATPYVVRMGMSMYDSTYRRWRYRWLDEAITERLTLDMCGSTDSVYGGAYLPERMLYQGLLFNIPEELFLRAQFEQTSVNGEVPQRERLIQSIDSAYHPGFLREVDDHIHAHGIESVFNRFNIYGQWIK